MTQPRCFRAKSPCTIAGIFRDAALALAGILVVSPAGSRECVVTGRATFWNALVQAGKDAFLVNIFMQPMKLTVPEQAGRRFIATFGGAVAFSINIDTDSVPVVPDSVMDVANDMIHLMPGAWLEVSHSRGNQVVASLVLSTCCGKSPEFIRPLRLNCADVVHPEAHAGIEDSEFATQFEGYDDSAIWSLRDSNARSLRLRAAPGWNAASLVIQGIKRDFLPFSVQLLEERGDWVKVRRWNPYVYVTGWIRRSELGETLEDVTPENYCQLCHYPSYQPPATRGARRERVVPSSPSEGYTGPARVAAGTKVYYGDGDAWGTVTDEREFSVGYVYGRDRVTLLEIPGLAGKYLVGDVPLSAVTFPQNASSPTVTKSAPSTR